MGLAATILATVLCACDKAPEAVNPTTGPSSTSDDLAEVHLGYFANVTHAQAVLGVSTGDFQTALGDTKLKTFIFNAGPSLIDSLISGDIDIAYVGPGPALTAWARTNGEQVRVIAGAADNGVVIVARKGSGINTLADLKGRKIATPQRNNTQDMSARHYVLSVLGQTDDRNVLPIANAQQAGRMAAGDIDAAWVPEPWGSRLVAEGNGQIIAQEKDLWPDHQFSLTVIVARPAFLQAHPDVVRRILTVHKQWTQKLNDNPSAYAAQLSDALHNLTHTPLSVDLVKSSLQYVTFTSDPAPATFTAMAQWSQDLGIVKQPIHVEGLIDTSVIDQIH